MISMGPQAAFATAEEGVALNPMNPDGRHALAAGCLRAGWLAEAQKHGKIAADILTSAHSGFFFEGISALVALSLGDLEGVQRARHPPRLAAGQALAAGLYHRRQIGRHPAASILHPPR